jgi:hypothetical protein
VQIRCEICSDVGAVARCPLCLHLFCVDDDPQAPSCALFHDVQKAGTLDYNHTEPTLVHLLCAACSQKAELDLPVSESVHKIFFFG